jgi:hypothetical protein
MNNENPTTNSPNPREDTMTKAQKNAATTAADVTELTAILASLSDKMADRTAKGDKDEWGYAGSLGYLRSQLLETLDGFGAILDLDDLKAAAKIRESLNK